MNKLTANPRARIALLAVLVVAAGYFLLRGRGQPADPTAGLPVTPTGGDLASLAGGDVGGGAAAADTSAFAQQLADFQAHVNDQFGHFQDLEDAYGQLKAGDDPFGSTSGAADGGWPGLTEGPPTGAKSRMTGASNPTGSGTAGGDGSAAAPGNAAISRLATLVKRATNPNPPKQPPARAPRRPGRNRGRKPRLGYSGFAFTKSGAFVVTRPASTGGYAPLNIRGYGGGYSPPTSVLGAVAAANARISGGTRAAAPARYGGGGGYTPPPPVAQASLLARLRTAAQPAVRPLSQPRTVRAS